MYPLTEKTVPPIIKNIEFINNMPIATSIIYLILNSLLNMSINMNWFIIQIGIATRWLIADGFQGNHIPP